MSGSQPTNEVPGADDHGVADGEAVVYRADDYAGLLRRTLAIAIDLAVLGTFWMAYELIVRIVGLVPLDEAGVFGWYITPVILVAYLYLTVLKRSRVRTPGYFAAGIRIVDLRGRPPSMSLMSLRLFWWALGPVNPLIDLFFMSGDNRRQTLRDKLLGTYVVRVHAEPVGTGRVTTGRIGFLAMMISFPEVVVPPSPVPSAAD